MGYDRGLIYKQRRQESSFSCFSFASYLQKCVTQIFRALYGDALFVPFRETQTWRWLSNINICQKGMLKKSQMSSWIAQAARARVNDDSSFAWLFGAGTFSISCGCFKHKTKIAPRDSVLWSCCTWTTAYR